MLTRLVSLVFSLVGIIFLAAGIGVFAIRLIHEGPYAMPHGGPLYVALAAIVLGGILLWGRFRILSWIALIASPVILFPALYSIGGEAEEVISLYAMDSENERVDLRLWVVDREDGAWVGMSKDKAVEHSLDGAQLEMLRGGEMVCVTPVLHTDRPTVSAIHGMKVEKYQVAQFAGSLGVYPMEAPENGAALRLDPCAE